jgi:DNA topoisomerase-1
VLGVDPASGEPITAQNGRYGPYLALGKETRSLSREDELFTLTLDQARALLAEPKARRGGEAKPPLKELGPDPATGAAMVVKDGRFGPYVTDGTTNASLRKADSIEDLTVERAAELLADRRAAGPSKKRGAKKSTAPRKVAATKKATAKLPAAKKLPAKKSTAKKKAAGTKAAATRPAPRKATAEE